MSTGRGMRGRVWGFAGLFWSATAVAAGSAAGRGVDSGKGGDRGSTATTIAALANGDLEQVRNALKDARSAGSGGTASLAVTSAVEGLLRQGTLQEIALDAVALLGMMGRESSSATLVPYARHRSPELRRAAEQALIKTGGPSAVTTLRRGLSDVDPGVRGIAASGLGTLKANDALDDLFVALDHNVSEAAAAIGEICPPDACEKFAAKLQHFPLDLMTSGFDQILFRPASEIPDDEKIRIVGRLRELGTPEANRYLVDVRSRLDRPSARTKQALDQAILATSGGLRRPPSEATP